MNKKHKYKSKIMIRHERFLHRKQAAIVLFFAICLALVIGIIHFAFPKIQSYNKKKKAKATTEAKTTAKAKTTTTTGNWYDYNAIAHALGGIDGHEYTNSKEAFEAAIKDGFHIFEMDLMQTTDHVLVGRHTWGVNLADPLSKGDDNVCSYKEFKATKLYGKYTPLSFEDALKILDQHPDIYLMTDMKNNSYASDIQQVIQTAKKLKKEYLLDRLVIQIYNQDMLRGVRAQYNFKHILYTTYKQTDIAFSHMIDFCKANRVEAVTVPASTVNDYRMELLEKAGLKSYTNTINSTYEVEQYMKLGVYGVYTDYVKSSEISQIYLNLQADKMIDSYSQGF